MNARDTGGSAFPLHSLSFDQISGTPFQNSVGGMTLRDWFAGQALGGMLGGTPGSHLQPEACAKAAYSYADALLAERSK